MIYELYSNINRLTNPSFQKSASKFQGRIYHSLTQEINGDRMIELAKVIGAFAFIALSVSILAGGIYLFISRVISKQKNQPLKYKPKIIEENLNAPANPANHADPENNKIAVQQPSKLMKGITPVELSPLREMIPLNVLNDDQRSNLKRCLTQAYQCLKDLDAQMGPFCKIERSIPDQTFLDQINRLKSFQYDALRYEPLATDLKKCLQSYLEHDTEVASKFLNMGKDYTAIANLIRECKSHLSLVYVAECERYFNQSDFKKCCQIAKRCLSDRELKKEIFRALIIRQINLGNLDEAYNFYIAAVNKDLAELVLHIAKMHFNQGNLDKALELAPQLVVSVNSQEFILKLSEAFFILNELKKALTAAKILGISPKKEALIFNIASALSKNNPDEAFQVFKGIHNIIYREHLISDIIDYYLARKQPDQALSIACSHDLTFAERDKMLHKFIIPYFYNYVNPQRAIKIALGMTPSRERESLINKMQNGLPI